MKYLPLLLALLSSCVEQKPNENHASPSERVKTPAIDFIAFTSGIGAILHDRNGQYWLGSHNEGLAVYNGDRFSYFNTDNGLPHNQVRSIHEDENGTIWISTAGGVCSYDGVSIQNYSANPISTDWNVSNGPLWFYAFEDGGVFHFDGSTLHSLAFPRPEYTDPNNSFGVTDITRDNTGVVWIATYAALFSFDGGAVEIFDHDRLGLEEHELLHIRSVFADSQGRIWIGNNGIGALVMDGDYIQRFSKGRGELVSINDGNVNVPNAQMVAGPSLQAVFAIAEDKDGNIWFGDRDTGAWKYDGESLVNYTIDASLSSQMVWDIYLDRNKELLFGMQAGGVYKLNDDSFERMF